MIPVKSLPDSRNCPDFIHAKGFFKFLIVLLLLPFCGTLSAQCDLVDPGCAASLRLYSLMEQYTIDIDDTAEISLTLYFKAESAIDTTVELSLKMPEENPEISIAGGDFSESGEKTVDLQGASGYVNVTVLIRTDSTATPGDLISIPVAIDAPNGFCDKSDTIWSIIRLYVIDADASTCKCENENGNVNLKGNILLSQAIEKGYFGDPNSPPNIPPCISINGILAVDIPYFYVSNCEILMGPTARISVYAGSTLYLKNNHIHGCDYLWHSIDVSGSIIAESNVIEDAEFAISFAGSGTGIDAPIAQLSNNVFNKDYVGIQRAGSQISDVKFKRFTANEFTCEGETLLPVAPNSLIPVPHPASKTFAGVYLIYEGNTANLSGIPVSGINHFHHIQNGIIADVTNVIVRNTRFNDIPVNDDYKNYIFGIGNGIFSNGGIIQEGQGA